MSQRAADGEVVTGRDVLAGLREVGVEPGGTVLVHSSLSAFGYVDGAEHAVIDALLAAVGPTGLLAMPTHTWGTVSARQPVFHEELSPSIVGRITESFRRRPGVRRSLHPTHSVAAAGPDAEHFTRGHERYSTPCPPPSPYGQLVDRGGHVLLLGVGLESFTLMHGFEEWACVPWLFNRTEDLWVVTRDHRAFPVPSRRHTDDPRFKVRDFPALEPLLHDRGVIRYATVGAAQLRLIDAAAARTCMVPLLAEHPDIVLRSRTTPVPDTIR